MTLNKEVCMELNEYEKVTVFIDTKLLLYRTLEGAVLKTKAVPHTDFCNPKRPGKMIFLSASQCFSGVMEIWNTQLKVT